MNGLGYSLQPNGEWRCNALLCGWSTSDGESVVRDHAEHIESGCPGSGA